MPTAVPWICKIKIGRVGNGLRVAARRPGRSRHFGQAEIKNLGVTAIGNEDVRRFDIAMHDAFAVCGLKRVGHFNCEREQALLFHGSAFDQVLQRLAGQALHHDEQMSIVLSNFVDGADVGMIQGRSSASFPAKALQSLWILRGVVRKKLECDEAAEQRVFGLVHHSHATTAEQFDDPVVGDGLSDHFWSINRRRRCQIARSGNPPSRAILG